MIESLGIENMLIIKFDKDFSQLNPDKFLEKYIVDGIGAKEVQPMILMVSLSAVQRFEGQF